MCRRYHGFTPAVCSVALFWSCYFPCYEYAKDAIADASSLSRGSSLLHMTAAASAGFVTDVLTNPLWVVRTRLAAQAVHSEGAGAGGAATPPAYRGMRHAIARIALEEGPLAFFSGLSASVLGLSHIMIQFPLYEWLKAELAERRARELSLARWRASGAGGAGGAGGGEHAAEEHSAVSDIVAASAISKLIASTITYPHEVIRARLQFDRNGRDYAGMADAFRKTLRHEGMGGLWLGFRLNIVRTIPQCVVTFTLYEFFSRRLPHVLGLRGRRDGDADGDAAGSERARSEDAVRIIVRTRSESRG